MRGPAVGVGGGGREQWGLAGCPGGLREGVPSATVAGRARAGLRSRLSCPPVEQKQSPRALQLDRIQWGGQGTVVDLVPPSCHLRRGSGLLFTCKEEGSQSPQHYVGARQSQKVAPGLPGSDCSRVGVWRGSPPCLFPPGPWSEAGGSRRRAAPWPCSPGCGCVRRW